LNCECRFCDPAKRDFAGTIDEPTRSCPIGRAFATSRYLRAQRSKLYHFGVRATVARNTLANANAVRDWRIYADFAQSLIAIARPLYVAKPFGVDLKESV
jgi:hypothetical protein